MTVDVPLGLSTPIARTPLCEVDHARALVRIPGIGRAVVGADGVVVCSLAAGTAEGAQHVLRAAAVPLGHVLAGSFPMRGAACSIDGSGVVITGSPGGGSSTVVAALAVRGHPILADGCVVIDGDPPVVTATSTRVDLWPDAVVQLGLAPDRGRPIRPGIDKATFEIPVSAGCPSEAGLALVVQQRLDNIVTEIEIEPLRGFDAIDVLIKACWHGWALAGLDRASDQMAWLTALLRTTRVVRLRVPRRRGQAGRVADIVTSLVDYFPKQNSENVKATLLSSPSDVIPLP